MAHALADDEALSDEVPDDGVSNENGVCRVAKLAQSGLRSAPERGEGIGKAHGFDDAGRRCVEVLFSHEAGDGEQPVCGDVLWLRIPNQVIEGGRPGAGSVAGGERESLVGPRDDGRADFQLRESLEEGVVWFCGLKFFQGGHVPGAADDGDALVAGSEGGADGAPHEGFAELIEFGIGDFAAVIVFGLLRFCFCFVFSTFLRGGVLSGVVLGGVVLGGGFSKRAHEGVDSGEEFARVGSVLDEMLPPVFAIVESGGGGDLLHGVRIRPAHDAQGEHGRGGQVHEGHRHLVRGGPAEGLEFRRELGEGIVGGESRRFERVFQHRDGGLYRRVKHEWDQQFGAGWAFDEDDLRLPFIEGSDERTGRAGPVVPNSEQSNRIAYRSSRHAR